MSLSVSDIDWRALTPGGRETLEKIAIPIAEEDLDYRTVAERLGIDRREVTKRLTLLADEIRAQFPAAIDLLPAETDGDPYDELRLFEPPDPIPVAQPRRVAVDERVYKQLVAIEHWLRDYADTVWPPEVERALAELDEIRNPKELQ